MRYLLLILMTFSFSLHAFAKNGNKQAHRLCSEMTKSKQRIKCNYLVDNKFFDRDAVKTCSSIKSTNILLDCLTTIAGFKYKNAISLGNCSMRDTDARKYRCLTRVKDKKIKLYRKNKIRGNSGLDAAFALCDSHLRNSDKASCMKIVRGKSFDDGAVSVCRNLTYTTDKNKCLEIIGDQKYNVSEVAICRKMTFTADKLKCLKHDSSNTMAASNDANSSDYDQALNVCGSFMYASDKNKCLDKVRGKKFAAGTVSVCKGLMYVADKLKCLDTIADKKYNQTELKICSGMMYTSEKLKCLTGAATSDVKPKSRSAEELVVDALGFLRSGKTNRAKRLLKKALSKM